MSSLRVRRESSLEDPEVSEHMFKLLKSFTEEGPRDEAGKMYLSQIRKSPEER